MNDLHDLQPCVYCDTRMAVPGGTACTMCTPTTPAPSEPCPVHGGPWPARECCTTTDVPPPQRRRRGALRGWILILLPCAAFWAAIWFGIGRPLLDAWLRR